MTTKEITLAVNLLGPLVALFWCTGLLVLYELRRKWPKDRYTGKLKWVQANIVELLIFLMFVAIAAPDWGSLMFGTTGG